MGLFKKDMQDAVRGTGEVVSASSPMHGYEGYVKLIISANGVPPTPAEYSTRSTRHIDRWPSDGDTIPITVDRADPQNFEIEWSEIPKIEDRIRANDDALMQQRLAERRGEQPPPAGSGTLPNAASAIAAIAHDHISETKQASASDLLATGQRMTAVLREFSPTGKTVGEVSPGKPNPHDPVYVLKFEIPVEGSSPIEAVCLQRVAASKVDQLRIGARLNVAVNPANPTREVAVDWDTSPLAA